VHGQRAQSETRSRLAGRREQHREVGAWRCQTLLMWTSRLHFSICSRIGHSNHSRGTREARSHARWARRQNRHRESLKVAPSRHTTRHELDSFATPGNAGLRPSGLGSRLSVLRAPVIQPAPTSPLSNLHRGASYRLAITQTSYHYSKIRPYISPMVNHSMHIRTERLCRIRPNPQRVTLLEQTMDRCGDQPDPRLIPRSTPPRVR
jgi:hypothetical protein